MGRIGWGAHGRRGMGTWEDSVGRLWLALSADGLKSSLRCNVFGHGPHWFEAASQEEFWCLSFTAWLELCGEPTVLDPVLGMRNVWLAWLPSFRQGLAFVRILHCRQHGRWLRRAGGRCFGPLYPMDGMNVAQAGMSVGAARGSEGVQHAIDHFGGQWNVRA
ncbi:unnamed protein product [Ostreobium quekettii]|uniref:Uncharacterized protein n=1 Tax=Ostreobium quekettii TaxID=121088 RepID=A0A8S1JF89_9CHLO|nr:unnamed protein product [Ostreobium quekettii]